MATFVSMYSMYVRMCLSMHLCTYICNVCITIVEEIAGCGVVCGLIPLVKQGKGRQGRNVCE